MKTTFSLNRSIWANKSYLILLFSICFGLALTHYWLQFSAQASADMSAYSSSSDPYLFKDLISGNQSSSPYNFVKFGGQMYFFTNNNDRNFGLWRSDGTITGTVLVVNINTGSQCPSPNNLTVSDDALFFTAFGATEEMSVWKSDGTAAGTTQIPNAKTKNEEGMFYTGLASMNNLIYFYGGDLEHGYELWRTDGTSTGTMLIKDIRPGPESSYVRPLSNLNGTFYFFAYDGIHGFELWKSDGTSDGTLLVKDILPGPSSSPDPLDYNILVSDRQLFFVAYDVIHGYELWKSNGTPDGTELVKDIKPGESGSMPLYLTNYDGELFFYADDGVHGSELWKSDGTPYGTTLVKDLTPGSQGLKAWCYPCQLGPIHQGYLYFEVGSETTRQLWRTDGTGAGTIYILDLFPAETYSSMFLWGRMSLNNILYINRVVDGQIGIWKSEGADSLTLFATGVSARWPKNPGPGDIISNNYFFLGSSYGYGNELWAISVTAYSALDLSLSAHNVLTAGGTITYTLAFNNAGDTSATNVILTDTLSTALHSIDYISTGAAISLTATSPYRWEIADLNPGDGGVITITAEIDTNLSNGTVITNTSQIGAQMSDGIAWKSTRAKQGAIVDFRPTISDLNDVHTLVDHPASPITFTIDDLDTPLSDLVVAGESSNVALIPNDHIVFDGDGAERSLVIIPEPGVTGSAIITVTVSDGSTTSFDTFIVYVDNYTVSSDPYLFKDIVPGTGWSQPSNFVKYKDYMYFSANDSAHGYELWRSDGTITGTVMFMDILTGSQSSVPRGLSVMDDALFFSAHVAEGSEERSVWKSDGTLSGTIRIPNAKTNCDIDMVCYDMANLNNLIYFYGGDQEHGYELWRTDGTLTGTMLIKDINPGSGSSGIVQLKNVSGTLYFFAYDGIHGYELWKSDGTSDGTLLVKDINPGSSSSPDAFGESTTVDMGNKLYFKANDGIHGYELWKSDGTPDGTQMVKDIRPGLYGSTPVYLTRYDEELFFYAIDDIHGRELWKSDGTTYGTTMVKDTRPGSEGLRNLCAVLGQIGPIHQGYLYYEASSQTDRQLWRTDGTEAGTTYVMDLAPETDLQPGCTRRHTSINNLLYVYRYVDGQNGIWKSDGVSSPTLIVTGVSPVWSRNPLLDDFINNTYFFSANSNSYGNELWAIPVTTYSALDLSLSSQNVLKAGGTITYSLAVSNAGDTDATNVILTDTLSTALHAIDTISSGAAISLTATSPYRWEIGDLAPGDGGVITITAAIDPNLSNGTVITNTAQLSAQMSDGLSLKSTRAKQGAIVDFPPTISDLNDVHTLVDHPTSPITFTIDDIDTPMSDLVVTGASSNVALVPNDHIVFEGAGAERSLVITPEPGVTGLATITVTVSDGSTTSFDTFIVYVDKYTVSLPVIQNLYVIYIPPGHYPVNLCTQSDLYIRGSYAGILEECVTSVDIRNNGYMQFNYTWYVDLIDSIPSIIKYPDTDNPNMYITDNLGNRYDHVAVGGTAGQTVTMHDDTIVGGWFLFIPPKQPVTTFTFYDDDQNASIPNIHLWP